MLWADFTLFLDTGSGWKKRRKMCMSQENKHAFAKQITFLHILCYTLQYIFSELFTTDEMDREGREDLLVPGLMSDMSIKGPVFWMRAGWWTDTPVQKL